MLIYKAYGETFGQHLSTNKCKFYSSSITPRNILGFSSGRLPFTYLGVPLFKGKPKALHLQPIADKIKLKMASWKGSTLSILGRVQLG